MEQVKPKYYAPETVITKNRNINYIVGARSIGKTYGFKKFLLSQAIKGKGKFIYLRRTKVQVESITDFFGEVLQEPSLSSHVFKQKGNRLYAADTKNENDVWNWEVIGIMYGMSEVNKIRSIEYPDYKYLMFEEFLPDQRGQFYKKEVNIFLDILWTIFRNRDFQVFALSNATVLHNPYFRAMDIVPNVFQEITYSDSKSALVQILESSEEWLEYMNTTPMGKLVKGTEYEEFSMGNKFKDNDNALVERKTRAAKNVAIFTMLGENIGVWYDKYTNYIYFSEDYNPTIKVKFGFYPEDYDEENVSYRELFNSRVLDMIIAARRNNRIRYTSAKAKAISLDGLERIRVF